MAKYDDLDLANLFGLSPEEALGLGLDASGRPPADDEPATPAMPAAAAAPSPRPDGTAAATPPRGLGDDLTLIAMLDSTFDDPDDTGYDGANAERGLSLAAAQETPQPPSSPVVRQESPSAATPTRPGDAASLTLLPDGDEIDIAEIFGLSGEEALGLGLPASVTETQPPLPTIVPETQTRENRSDTATPEPLAAQMETRHTTQQQAPGKRLPGFRRKTQPTRERGRQEPEAAGAITADKEHHVPPHDSDLQTLVQRSAAGPAEEHHGLEHAEQDVSGAYVTLDSPRPAVDPALLDAFAEESAELLDGLHVELERLEQDSADRDALLEIRRSIHTLKGGAKMCGFEQVVTLTHACENLLDGAADSPTALPPAALDALFSCEPLLRTAIQQALAGEMAPIDGLAALATRFEALCAETGANGAQTDADAQDTSREDSGPGGAATTTSAINAPPSGSGETDSVPAGTGDESMPQPVISATDTRAGGRRGANSINVDLAKVDAVVAKVSEIAAHRVSSQGMVAQLMETTGEARRNVTRLQALVTQVANKCAGLMPDDIPADDGLGLESFNALNTLLLQLQEAVSDQQALVQSINDTLTTHWRLKAIESRIDADIQSALMNIRLIPIANMRVRLDGVIRQAAQATGKAVRWHLQGGNVAVEKNVFDRLFEPLMHLLRNAVDHGIEPPAARRAAGKPETGAVTVSAAQGGNQIVITVSDDGAGIVPNRIAAIAVDRGLITSAQAATLTPQQKLNLIFTPGFSTAGTVSHFSGRGVGMDAVRESCLRMGGSIDVSSRPGIGTTFTLRLPLSLAVTRGLIVRDGGAVMAIPVSQITALHLVPAGDVVEAERGRVARIEGQELPVYNLPRLGNAGAANYVQNGEVNVLQVPHEGGSIGILIEDVLDEEEILIKAPPPLLRSVKTLLGAYVLPDGNVAPVVNLPQMLAALRPATTLCAPHRERAERDLTALIVDDSMSMRVALSGTLQSAGFKVLTARDGQEALDVLKREGLPDLITLDVEMPRMDGLETLFAIRQLPGAHALPVFMMTSRGGARHRRAAEQLGCTRYFTKPYRDSELATAAREACAGLES